jgi:hypothetical protein
MTDGTMDPGRWVDDAGAPDAVRELLADARADVLDADAVARVRAGVAAKLAAGGGTAVAATLGKKGLGLIGLVAAGAVGLGVWGATRPRTEDPADAVEPTRAEGPVHVPEETIEPELPALSNVGPPGPPEPASERPRKKSPKPRAAAAPTRAEASILLAARRALPHDPEKALSLTERHERRFPGSALAEERHVLAIRALVRLGRTAEAEQHLGAFRRRHPDSPHLTAARKAIARGSRGD